MTAMEIQPSSMFRTFLMIAWSCGGAGHPADHRSVRRSSRRLGSFATAYLPDSANAADIADRLAAVDGIMMVIDRAEAVTRFELPADRIGDLVIVSNENITIGTSRTGMI